MKIEWQWQWKLLVLEYLGLLQTEPVLVQKSGHFHWTQSASSWELCIPLNWQLEELVKKLPGLTGCPQ